MSRIQSRSALIAESIPHDLGSANHDDVDFTNIQNDDIVKYETATGKWKNTPITAIPSSATGANVGGQTGEIFRDKTGNDINLKTLKSTDSSIIITNNIDDIDITVDDSQISKSLNDLTDVTITAPAIGQVVTRNGANDGWENGTLPLGTYDALTDTTITGSRQTGDVGVWNGFINKYEVAIGNQPEAGYYRYQDPRSTGGSNAGRFSISGNDLYIHPDDFKSDVSTIIPNLKQGDMIIIQDVNGNNVTNRFAIAGDGVLEATEGDYRYPISDGQSTGALVSGLQYFVNYIISSSTVTAHSILDTTDVTTEVQATGDKLIWAGPNDTAEIVSYQPALPTGYSYATMEANVTNIYSHYDYSDLATFDDAGMTALVDRVSSYPVYFRNGTTLPYIQAVEDVGGNLDHVFIQNTRNGGGNSNQDIQGNYSTGTLLDPTANDGFVLFWVLSDALNVLEPLTDLTVGGWRYIAGADESQVRHIYNDNTLQLNFWTPSGFTLLTSSFNVVTESAGQRVTVSARYRESDLSIDLWANGVQIASGTAAGSLAGRTIQNQNWTQNNAYSNGFTDQRPTYVKGYTMGAVSEYMSNADLLLLHESLAEEFRGIPRPVGANGDANIILTQNTDVTITNPADDEYVGWLGGEFINRVIDFSHLSGSVTTAQGGTGVLVPATTGDILFASDPNNFALLNLGTNNFKLTSDLGTSGVPIWKEDELNDNSNVNITSAVDGNSLLYFGSQFVNRQPNDGTIKINNGNGTQPTFINLTVAQPITYTAPLGISSFPTSSPPLAINNGVFVDADIYDFINNRFLEQQLTSSIHGGQITNWRVIVNYSSKPVNNSGKITITISNPLSGFVINGTYTMPQGVTGENDIAINIVTIADDASKLPVVGGTGAGYDFSISATTSVDVTVVSIARIADFYSQRA